MNKLFQKIMKFVRKTSISKLQVGLLTLGMIILVVFAIVGSKIGPRNIPEKCKYLVFSCTFFIAGSAGLVQVIKKEAPGLGFRYPYKGALVVISGIALMVIFWLASLIFLYVTIFGP
jgi:hypothetical protein